MMVVCLCVMWWSFLGFVGEMLGIRVNIVLMDVNIFGYLNFFVYRLSKF